MINDQQISQTLKLHYGFDVKNLLPLVIGADINARVFKADTHDQSYFVKLKNGHHDEINLAVVARLVQAGVKSIIPPIKTNQRQFMVDLQGYHLIVYPFIDAKNGFSQEFSEQQWIQFGKALRQIHDLDVPIAIREILRKENYSPKFRQSVRLLYNQFNKLILKDEVAEKLFAYLKQEKKTILALVDGAEKLAQKISNLNHEYVLCHSDIHGGNVLITDNEQIYIVDWDEPMMAPKERDLMFIGGGVGNVWNQPDEETLFYQGYSNTVVDKNILAYYRYERIFQDIAEFVQQLLLSSAGGEDRKVMYQHFVDMFASRGVVEIALEMTIA